LVFGSVEALEEPNVLDQVRQRHPGARLVGCSTAGEICGTQVTDNSVVVTAIQSDQSRFVPVLARISQRDSYAAGRRLASDLPQAELVHVLVFSEGVHVNGTDLVERSRFAAAPDEPC
jgi:hypothetical protein